MNAKTRKIAMIGMLTALAYAAVFIGRFPVVLFLKYDPKDVIIAIGGFIYGPLTSLLLSVVVSTIEMFTISDTGALGMVMNVISSCSFCCTASLIYKKIHNLRGAIIGLICGCALMVFNMMLWNYFIAPIYMGYPRQAVLELLLPAFLPFNLIKSCLNAAITLLIYKPLANALRHRGLIDSDASTLKSRPKTGLVLICSFVAATCVLFILALNDVI